MLTSLFQAFKTVETGIYRKFFSLAWPISVQLVLASSLALVDVLMVSSEGSTAVAAVGLASKFFFVIILMISGIANGASVLAAQYVGVKDEAGVKRILAIALCAGWFAALPFTLLTWLIPEQLMALSATDPELIAVGARFLKQTAPFHMIMATVSVISAILRAYGKSMLPMLVGFVAIACNTLLNYFLIYGSAGFPKMGVDGAAISTLIAKVVECSLMIAVIYLSNSSIRLSLHEFLKSFNAAEVRRFMTQSLPLVANEIIWAMGIFSFTVVYGHMGTAQLASTTLLAPIENLSIEIFIGFTSAASILISTRLGARQFDEAKCIAWVLGTIITLATLFYGVLLIFFRASILAVYADVDTEVLLMAQDVFMVIALTLWLRLYNVVACVSILRSGGDVRFTLYVDLVVIWLIVLPVTAYFGLVQKWPVQWVYAVAVGLEALVKAPIYTLRISTLVWLKSLVSSGFESEHESELKIA